MSVNECMKDFSMEAIMFPTKQKHQMDVKANSKCETVTEAILGFLVFKCKPRHQVVAK